MFVFSGCATAPHAQKIESKPQVASSIEELKPGISKEISTADDMGIADGIIFGKVDFRGVLKVEYVKMNIVDVKDPQKQYDLLFGEAQDARPIEPHYFFWELPEGHYRITTISIPVGTTLAAEKTDISFEVEKDTVIYLGTLRVTGTDQKIRFGGVPLLRPGFEYRVEIINENENAIAKFKKQYPGVDRDIQIKLMKAVRFQTF